jgi:hypothetical protein
MKKLLLLAVCIAGAVSVVGQGTVNVANVGVGVNAPVFNVDTTTRLAGNQFMAQLLVNGTPVGAPTPFLSGGSAGFFLGGVQDAGVAAGTTVTAVVQAWDTATGATFDAALIKGVSAEWQLDVVGNPAGQPPAPPAALVGMTSFSLVPEPSTIALAVLGGVALLFRRRK